MTRRSATCRFEPLEPRRVLATLALNAGGGPQGAYQADDFFTGGGQFSTSDTINVAGAVDPAPAAVYQSERTGQSGSDFRYDFTGLTPGETYDLRLHFAEIFWSEAGKRSFDVLVNNTQVLNDYDVFVEAGGADLAVIEEFTTTADAGGAIRVDFLTEMNNAKVSGIELIGEFPPEPEKPTLLFVRGADRSGGFLEANNDSQRTEQLADLFNTSTSGGNHGWAELRQTLVSAGFAIEQITETAENGSGPSDGVHIDFEQLDLTEYDAIVFGSNNAVYDTAAIDAIEAYVRGGGSTLFISDANFGGDWADASDSDQQFLDRFGLIMHQDQGTYSLFRSQGDYAVPGHPILTGVDRFDGEGVTPIELGTPTAGVDVDLIVGAEGSTRLNQPPFGGNNQGPSRSSNPTIDGVLVAGTADAGKIAGHYDRNTFFNQNGAGTNINRFDNKQYALNLFGWLVGAFDPLPGDYDGNGAVEQADHAVWAAAYGTVGASPADGNGDGRVDAADYTVWRDNLGATAPAVDLSLPATVTATPAAAYGMEDAALQEDTAPPLALDEPISAGALDAALLLISEGLATGEVDAEPETELSAASNDQVPTEPSEGLGVGVRQEVAI
ncbi:Di-glucose binding within endoplasmic reticulum [Planctomycetes bacterium MalM25]|nr:Di-glucose binding within endoplasmic reticulum [Planctomycetes bacterium MalM25]